jgi:hypothetical protein
VTGMQTARLKAESQGRKAKVGISARSFRRKEVVVGEGCEGLTVCVTACQFIS